MKMQLLRLIIVSLLGGLSAFASAEENRSKIYTLNTSNPDFSIQEMELFTTVDEFGNHELVKIEFIDFDADICILCNDNQENPLRFFSPFFEEKRAFSVFNNSRGLNSKSVLEHRRPEYITQTLVFENQMKKLLERIDQTDGITQQVKVRIVDAKYTACGTYCTGTTSALSFVETNFSISE